MHIEVLAIGNEIIAGQTINSNASYISKKLEESGYRAYSHLVLPDDKGIIQKELAKALKSSDVVISSGGLGPTLDDITKEVVADLFKVECVIDEGIKENLKKRFPGYISIEKDASIPKGAITVENKVGTAFGIIIEKDNKTLILLPGVPSELKPMFDESVIPYLAKKFPTKQRIYQRKVGIFLKVESEINPILEKYQLQYPNTELGIYPDLGYVTVKATKILVSKDDPSYNEVDKLIDMIKSSFPSNIFEDSIILDLHKLLLEKKYKIAIAESCTGGAVSAALVQTPGASNYLEGAIVTYSNEMKTKLLHVSKKTLSEKGAVSIEVVDEMLSGLLNITGADFALATSGIAGPEGGSKDKPVGTVCIGCADKNLYKDIGFIHTKGSRERVIESSVNRALAILLKRIKYDEYTFRK